MKKYKGDIIELIDLARLLGICIQTKATEDFDLTTLGDYDPTSKTITLYYEKEIVHDAATLFTLAHELRHAYQHLTGRFEDWWVFAVGMGPKPTAELKDAMEADADDFAEKYLRGRGIRIPKNCLS